MFMHNVQVCSLCTGIYSGMIAINKYSSMYSYELYYNEDNNEALIMGVRGEGNPL